VDSDTSDDYGIIVSNQFGWGYVIGTTGAFSDVVASSMPNRSYASTNDDHPIVLPKDHLEGIGYDTDPTTAGLDLYPPSLHQAQLWLRLCGSQHGCP
jgi:hypothetical protein